MKETQCIPIEYYIYTLIQIYFDTNEAIFLKKY